MLRLLSNFKIYIHLLLFNSYLLRALQKDEEMRNRITALKKCRAGNMVATIS